MKQQKNRAIFLDRDGIINVDSGYVHKIEDFKFTSGIFKTLQYLQKQGYILVIVTNQSGIARGYYDEQAYMDLTIHMMEKLSLKGISIKGVYHCPHGPDEGCRCRKPRSGMFKVAQKEFKLDMKNSWMIGDKESDMKAGVNAGVKNRILLSKEKGLSDATHRIKKISDVIDIIV